MSKLYLILLSVLIFSAIALADFANSLSGEPANNVCGASSLSATGGKQSALRSCSATQLGELPDANHMPSTFIAQPKYFEVISRGKSFTILVRTRGFEGGNLANPDTEYFSFSQQLNKGGIIKGHASVVIQRVNESAPSSSPSPKGNANPPNPEQIAFFQEISSAANEFTVSVPGIASLGVHRICVDLFSFSRQPVVMPVAQRGAQSDCSRVVITP